MPQQSQVTTKASEDGRIGGGSVPRAKEIESERSEGESIMNPLRSEISKEHSKKGVA